MTHDTPLIAMLAAGFVLAFIFGFLAQRLRLSPLVGYLVAGMVVGPFTPGFVADQALAGELAEVGVILLMFGVGLHFSPADLLDVRRTAIPGALAGLAIATILGMALALSFGWRPLHAFVFGLSLSAASTVVLLRRLEDHRLLDTARGKIAIGWVVVEDLVMVLALVLLPVLAHALSRGGGVIDPGALAAALAITLGKLFAFAALMWVVGRRAVPPLLELVAGLGSRELFTLAILAIAIGVAFGSARLFGVSFALGAFFAGMLLNESELSHKAAADSLPLRDAFAVLFFVSVGMLFDPGILIAQPLPVLATALIIIVGKPLVAGAVVRWLGHPPLSAATIAASLAQIGEFSFILAGLGVALGILPPEGRDLVLAGALLSIVLNPFLFVALGRWQEMQPATPTTAPVVEGGLPPGPPMPTQGHALLIGYGRVGRQLALLLKERGVALAVMDNDGDLVQRAHADGIAGIRGNAATQGILDELAATTATHALLAIPNAFEAGKIVSRLKRRNPEITILARAHSEAEVGHLLERGADATVLAERELAYSMAEMVMADPRLSRPAP